MLTSLEVIEAAGISRATLNNYIALGLLPRPVVTSPAQGAPTRARQIGYFPEGVIAMIERIKQLKIDGMSMSDIAQQLGQEGFVTVQAVDGPKSAMDRNAVTSHQPSMKIPSLSPMARTSAVTETGPLRLTIDQVPYPAYMVNYNMEITWYNEEARTSLLGSFEKLPSDIQLRGVQEFLMRGKFGAMSENRDVFAKLHLALGRERVAAVLGNAALSRTGAMAGIADVSSNPLADYTISLKTRDGKDEHYRVYASYFREGVLVIYVPDQVGADDSLIRLLERRDEVIRNLLKKRLPVLTDVAVMVADLQNSVRICSELPPEEYFELINQIWAIMDPIFRKYYGTPGKHVGDGMVYYFFPQPDCHYILNTLHCAYDMREAMRKISKEWQLRKNWLNELFLNIGLNEGQEWLGVFHIETKVEFTVLGDTINHAARLSDFARFGSIWASKNLLGKLTPEERQHVKFGVKREDLEGREVFVNASYSRLSELVDLASPRYEKLRDIGGMVVTEITGIESR